MGGLWLQYGAGLNSWVRTNEGLTYSQDSCINPCFSADWEMVLELVAINRTTWACPHVLMSLCSLDRNFCSNSKKVAVDPIDPAVDLEAPGAKHCFALLVSAFVPKRGTGTCIAVNPCVSLEGNVLFVSNNF